MLKKLRNLVAGHEWLLMIIIPASLNLLFIFVHECWYDEAQAWLIARDNTIFSLFDVTSYEGHPCLWFFVLMPFARLGFPYFTLKVISYLVMLAVIVIIAVKAPFENCLKAIFIFSPMCIYCFVTPARVYCLCALFVVLSAMACKDRDKHPLRYGLALALTLQTHIIMAGFVVASCCEWALSVLQKLYAQRRLTSNINWELGGLTIPFLSGLFLLFEFRDTATVLAYRYNLTLLSWWTPFLFMAICVLILGIKERINILAPFCVFILAAFWQVWIHIFIWYSGNFREITWGFLLLWLVWRLYDTNINTKPLTIPFAFLALLFSFYTWQEASWLDMLHDIYGSYSGAEAAAAVIEALPEDAVIFESNEVYCNTVIPYLKTKTIYNPFSESEASYTKIDPALRHSMSYEDFVSVFRRMFPDKDEVWIIHPSIVGSNIKQLERHFDKDSLYYSDYDVEIIRYENHFSIYHIKP